MIGYFQMRTVNGLELRVAVKPGRGLPAGAGGNGGWDDNMRGIVIIQAAFRPISAAIGSITLSRKRMIRGMPRAATASPSCGLCPGILRQAARPGLDFGREAARC